MVSTKFILIGKQSSLFVLFFHCQNLWRLLTPRHICTSVLYFFWILFGCCQQKLIWGSLQGESQDWEMGCVIFNPVPSNEYFLLVMPRKTTWRLSSIVVFCLLRGPFLCSFWQHAPGWKLGPVGFTVPSIIVFSWRNTVQWFRAGMSIQYTVCSTDIQCVYCVWSVIVRSYSVISHPLASREAHKRIRLLNSTAVNGEQYVKRNKRVSPRPLISILSSLKCSMLPNEDVHPSNFDGLLFYTSALLFFG